MSNDQVCDLIVVRFQLIANKARFRIVCLLRAGWFSVSEIVEIVQAGTLPNISQQLKILTLSGVLEKKKEGRNVFYRLKDESIREMISLLEKQYLEAPQ